MRKVWKNRRPHIGDYVLFRLNSGAEIVGCYNGLKDDCYELSNSNWTFKFPVKEYAVNKYNVEWGRVLLRRDGGVTTQPQSIDVT